MLELVKDDLPRVDKAKRDFAAECPADLKEDRFIGMRELMGALGYRTSESVYKLEKRKKLKLIRLNSRVAGVRASELRRFLRELEGSQRA